VLIVRLGTFQFAAQIRESGIIIDLTGSVYALYPVIPGEKI
jgi:hypothetical protein